MSLSPEQVQQVAHLARLAVSDTQVAAYSKQLSNILAMVDQLTEADTTGISPMAHPLGLVQRLRVDGVTAQNQREAFQAIAPSVEDGLYLVPKVIE
jgi:aspartyl-tRNA(Asn)/glutamyl-tRNA(Gln) amidotransferase subunit C